MDDALRRRVETIKKHAFQHPWRGDRMLTCPHHVLDVQAITDRDRRTRVICSFDIGYHTSGWFKNSDWEQNLHVSVSSVDPSRQMLRQVPADLGGGLVMGPHLETPTDAEVWAWATAFFREDAPKAWTEPAASVLDPYRMPNVVHLRLFYDQEMHPFMPSGEPYELKPLVGLSPEKIMDGAAGGDVR